MSLSLFLLIGHINLKAQQHGGILFSVPPIYGRPVSLIRNYELKIYKNAADHHVATPWI